MAHAGLSRDDLLRLIFEDDFCDQNPALAEHKKAIAACRAAYEKSAATKACRCGANPSVAFSCMDKVLASLTALKETNPAAVQTFVAYAGRKHNKPLTFITMYYRKTAETPLQKFRFP